MLITSTCVSTQVGQELKSVRDWQDVFRGLDIETTNFARSSQVWSQSKARIDVML